MPASDISMTSLKCPSCQAPLPHVPGAKVLVCQYCNTPVHVVEREENPDGTCPVRDQSGRCLMHMPVPFGWDIAYAQLDQSLRTTRWPFAAVADIEGDGCRIRYRTGEGFAQNSPQMQQIVNQYGQYTNGAIYVAYRNYPGVDGYTDQVANDYARSIGARNFRPLGTLPVPLREGCGQDNQMYERQYFAVYSEEARKTQAQTGQAVNVDGIFARLYAKKYEITSNAGSPLYMAVVLCMLAGRTSTSMGGFGGFGDFGGLGGLLGGLLGGMQQQPQQPQYQQQGGVFSSEAQLAQMSGLSVMDWGTPWIAYLVAPAERFDEVFSGAFADVCSYTHIDESVVALREASNSQDDANLRAATQRFNATINQIGENSRRYAAQMSAMSDARMESWQRQSDAHHAQVMESSRHMFDSGSGSGSAGDFSEAIRGVNTYVDKYGQEREFSVSADTVWQNENGDIAGFDAGVDPGYGWTRLQRK